MKTKLILSIIAIGLLSLAHGQTSTTKLSSTASENFNRNNLTGQKGMIKTQGDNTANYLADSLLLMDYSVEIAQINESDVVSPNARIQTTVSMYVPETDYVCIKITDLKGRTIISSRRLLEQGAHIFKYEPGIGDESFFTAYWHGTKSSIKIEHAPSSQNQPISLEYLGNPEDNLNLRYFKSMPGVESNRQDRELFSGKKKGL